MIKLGHIDYSNCIPIHAKLLIEEPTDIEIVRGTPAQLNAALRARTIDVAPASSIEFARNADRYRIFPEFAIGSEGQVQSIVLESRQALADLSDAVIAVPTASSTSVVLLKILLTIRDQVAPRFVWFDQDNARDPLADDATAALWIGDVALRRVRSTDRLWIDLGHEWSSWTNLPFVFALWQTSADETRDQELTHLHARLIDSASYFKENVAQLAARFAPSVSVSAEVLREYWSNLRYDLDEHMRAGLSHFYELASEIGEAPRVNALRWFMPS